MLISKNKKKMGKKALCLIFAFLLSIESFAAVVSDNDGSAFITKAEFDSLKNNFQSQLDSYNTSIDNKIDNAISSYLAGIKTERTEEKNLVLWGGRILGLVENEKARPYVEGLVGGRMDFTLWAAQNRNTTTTWSVGELAYDNSGTTGDQNPTWVKTCFHRFTAISVPFQYLVVDVNKSGGQYYFDLVGYSKIEEGLTALTRVHKTADLTQRQDWKIGLCEGVYPYRGPLETAASTYTNNFAGFCEATTRNTSYGSYSARGTAYNDHHNEFLMTYQDVNLTSVPTTINTYAYITNTAPSYVYAGVRPRDWHGANITLSTTEAHTKGELHMWGWNVEGARGTKFNFHIDARTETYEGIGSMFYDGAGVFNRIIQADPSYSSGSWGHYPSTMAHGRVDDNNNFYSLYKADVGGELKANNLYSNELANAIKSQVTTGLIRKEFNGIEKDVSPLYLGLPLVAVKEEDTVEIELELLDDGANYDIAFAVGGFDNNPIDASTIPDWGTKDDGIDDPIFHIETTRPNNKVKLKVQVTKPGLLFLKYGASGGTSQYIQLPNSCTITKKS